MTRRAASAVVAVMVLLVASLAFAMNQSRPSGEQHTLRWLALGDSYSSGHGNLPYDEAAPCTRASDDAYPLLAIPALIDEIADIQLSFQACSGAVIADLSAQVEAAEASFDVADVDVVTLTIGGNDLGFASLIASCASTLLTSRIPGVEPCVVRDADLDARFSSLRTSLAEGLSSVVATVGHRATVLLVGYPHLVQPDDACDVFGREESTRAWEVSSELDATLADVADSLEQVRYLSVLDVFSGHEICGDPGWVRGLVTDRGEGVVPSIGRSYHPNENGAKAYADVVVEAIIACCR